MIGSSIAELRFDEGTIRYERTTREPGHFPLCGDPVALLSLVVGAQGVATAAR